MLVPIITNIIRYTIMIVYSIIDISINKHHKKIQIYMFTNYIKDFVK